MAEGSLDDLIRLQRKLQAKELRASLARMFAGGSKNPQIIKSVMDRQAKPRSPAEVAEYRNVVTEQMAALQASLAPEQEGQLDYLEKMIDLEKALVQGKSPTAVARINGLNQQLLALEKAKRAEAGEVLPGDDPTDWMNDPKGSGPAAIDFREAADAVGDLYPNTGWQQELASQLEARPAGQKRAFLRAVAGLKGLQEEQLMDELAVDNAGGLESPLGKVKRALENAESTLTERRAHIEELETDVSEKQAELKGQGVGLTGAGKAYLDLVEAYMAGEEDPQALHRIGVMLGKEQGAPRKMSAGEEETYEQMKETLEFLASGEPDAQALKEAILIDPRFTKWADAQGYTNKEEAFKIWLKNADVAAKRGAKLTQRQERINAAAGVGQGGAIKRARGMWASTPSERQDARDAADAGLKQEPWSRSRGEKRASDRTDPPLDPYNEDDSLPESPPEDDPTAFNLGKKRSEDPDKKRKNAAVLAAAGGNPTGSSTGSSTIV